jgi:glycosyltransferase involved in cell wall biosynthesis
MRLLVLLPSTQRGGNEAHALAVAGAARAEGWEVHAAFPALEALQSLIDDCESTGIVYHRLAVSEEYRRTLRVVRVDGRNFVRTLRVLLRVRPDVVMVNLPWPTWGFGSVMACAALRLPSAVVFQLVAPDLVVPMERRRWYRWARARRQEWIAVSENNRTILSRMMDIPLSQIQVIYNGTKIPEPRRQEKAQIRQEVRTELGIPPSARILLTVGRLSRQKGYDLLLSVIPELLRDFPDVHCVWVGDGEERGPLQQAIARSGVEGHVHLLLYRNDVVRLMQAADLFVLPTYFEGHPFALMEAMAVGLPVVVSDASGIPEMVTHKVHGIVFRSGERNALQEALVHALRNGEAMQAMALAAAQRVRDFSHERMLEQTLHLLRTLAQVKHS